MQQWPRRSALNQTTQQEAAQICPSTDRKTIKVVKQGNVVDTLATISRCVAALSTGNGATIETRR